jgi:hypothetical protein
MLDHIKSLPVGAQRTIAAVVAAAAVLGYAGISSADDTTDAVENGFSSLQTLFTGTIAVALFALVIAIVGVTMGVKWLRRGAHSS